MQELVEHVGERVGEPGGFVNHFGVGHDRDAEDTGVGQDVEADGDVARVDRRRDDGSNGEACEGHRLGRSPQVGFEGVHQPLMVDEEAEQSRPPSARKSTPSGTAEEAR